MIDLSHLTEEEQEKILSVLKRDAELKHKEEERIKKLQKTERDKRKLKYLTGEWFYETKSNRHRDKIHGSDIIRASMMRRKPVTIMELTQIWPEKSSFLENKSKDIFIPAELSGLIGEPSSSAHDNREDYYQMADYKPSTQTKPRHNPFNSKPIGLQSPVKTGGHFQTGVNVQQIAGNSHQVPADQQPAVESLTSLPIPCRAPQIPAEDRHEELAEPRSSQVSEPSDSFIEKGKVSQLSIEGQPHTLTEEDESLINKVHGWVGMMSRHTAKGNERPGFPEEPKREGPDGRGTPDTKNASPTQTEIKATTSPKHRMGQPGLFLRKTTRVETSENVLYKDDVDDVCRLDDEQDHIILQCSAQNSASGLNFIREELEANPYLSVTDNGSDNIADDDIQQRESLYQDEKSQNLLASLMSFWESRNKSPKVLSIKENLTTENKVSDRKILEFSPSKAKTFGYTDTCDSYKGFSESRNGARHDDNISVIPSVGEKTSCFDTAHKPQKHAFEIKSTSGSLNSPTKQIDDIPIYKQKEMYSPVLSVGKAVTEQDTISDLKACWEREKSSPEIIIGTHDCISKHYSQQGLSISTSPNRVEIPDTSRSSLSRDLAVLNVSSKLKQSSKRFVVNSPLDDTDMKSYNRSPFRTCILSSDEGIKFNPVSYPIINICSMSQDHRNQSTGETMKILEQSRTLSPRNMPKVLSRAIHPVKESGMVVSPPQVFPTDISPTEKTFFKGLEHTPRGQTRYPHGLSNAEESSPRKDGKLLAERPEQHLLSFSENTSERNMQYNLTSPHFPPCFGSSQASGTICIDKINSKQTSHVHSLPVSKGQTSVQLITPPEHHETSTTKRSVEGIEDIVPVVLKEQVQLDDSQSEMSLTRSHVHLSCQHQLSLTESIHVSGFSDQPGTCEHTSPIQAGIVEKVIIFDSSSGTSAEVWSRASSACGSEDPSPVRTAQKQVNIRPLSFSKSLEDLATLPSKDERWINEPRSGIMQTVEEVPHALSIAVLDPEQSKRLSVSVPAFLHEQGNTRESDCLSVNSFYSERQRKSSTNTNTSASSGLASMSSISGSVTNIYGTDLGHVEVKGTIQFAINYVNKLGELHIFIVQCRDLAVAEPKRNRSDPYVKCYLLPDKAKLGKRKTSVKKKTMNPTYNEILRYKISLESLKVHTLNISVWHNDMFGRNSFLGEVNVDLSEWDNNTHMMDHTLKGRIATPSSPKHVNHNMLVCGDMRISLRFLLQTSQSSFQTGEIQVWVKECTDLQSRNGSINPFVKCSILPDSHQKNRQKTRVVKRTANPVFNHTMVYDGLRPEDLRDTCVELTVWDHDRLSNHFIGGIRLGLGTGKSHGTEVKWMDSNSAESALWRRMIDSKNEWVEDIITLRMLIVAR